MENFATTLVIADCHLLIAEEINILFTIATNLRSQFQLFLSVPTYTENNPVRAVARMSVSAAKVLQQEDVVGHASSVSNLCERIYLCNYEQHQANQQQVNLGWGAFFQESR